MSSHRKIAARKLDSYNLQIFRTKTKIASLIRAANIDNINCPGDRSSQLESECLSLRETYCEMNSIRMLTSLSIQVFL